MDTRQQMKKTLLTYISSLCSYNSVRLFINPQSDSVFPLLTGQVDK